MSQVPHFYSRNFMHILLVNLSEHFSVAPGIFAMSLYVLQYLHVRCSALLRQTALVDHVGTSFCSNDQIPLVSAWQRRV